MRTRVPSAERATAAAIAAVYLVGVAGHLLPPLQPFMRAATPPVLALMGLVVLGWAVVRSGLRLLLWVVVTYLCTFALESIGVLTGKVFGAYHYGTVLGPMLFDVPVVIGFNWVLVVLGAVSLAERMSSHVLLSSVYAAFMAVVFDLVLEPVAVSLGYWSWHAQQGPTVVLPAAALVPARNFAAWFLISLAAAAGYRALRLQRESQLPILYLGVQFVFFAAVLAGVIL